MNSIQKSLYNLYNYIFRKNSNIIHAYWFHKQCNFGDAINPYLIEKISKKQVVWTVPKKSLIENYLCIGSIIHKASKNSIIWGSGFIGENTLRNRPKKVCAVRGPKSRNEFLKKGIDCPEVYGDPALLLPMFYKPKTKKKYLLGIIPHYVDKGSEWLATLKNIESIKIIDVEQKDYLHFIDDICECETVASSSLHGLIVADAYNIPSIWIQFSDKIIGNNFKFYDYFESVGRINETPINITADTKIEEILKSKKSYKIKIDLNLLLEACPFSK